MFNVKIIEDSMAPCGKRLTTLTATYPRFIHSEVMTHRDRCLDGDCELEFDLPSTTVNGTRRLFKMTIRDFVDKWKNGARRGVSKRKDDLNLSKIEDTVEYSSKELEYACGLSKSNIDRACRDGKIVAVKRRRSWSISGESFKSWRGTEEQSRFYMPSLREMRIRQLDEATGRIVYSNVEGCSFSGIKEVFSVKAAKYEISGSTDHRIMTMFGWVKIGDLVPGVSIIVVEGFGKLQSGMLDPLRHKYIDGRWRSTWQRQLKEKLNNPPCKSCGHVIAECHHIEPVYKAPHRAFDESNIEFLCQDCHHDAHKNQDWSRELYLYGSYAVVESVTSIGLKETFDLAINGPFPNFIANGVVVHNSRNAASSRAIPWNKMKVTITENPVIPIVWGAEQSGMQTGSGIDPKLQKLAEELWLKARDSAVEYADMIHNIGDTYNEIHRCLSGPRPEFEGVRIHKSLPNRLTEPWMWITVVMTATEWANFYRLRCHPDAEIHFQCIANMMRYAMTQSTPVERECHLPFVTEEERWELDVETLFRISTARCARVSYLTHDGIANVDKDLGLFDKLVGGSGFGHFCYDSFTEVLTTKGWKYWPKVNMEDELATFKDGDIWFEKPSAMLHEQYEGNMYSVSGQAVDLLVTPEHNMYTCSRKKDGSWTPYEISPAYEIAFKPRRYLNSGQVKPSNSKNNLLYFNPEQFAKLVGFFIGDGNAEKKGANCLYFNLRDSKKINYLLSIIPDASMTKSGKWVVRRNGISKWFRDNCYDKCGSKMIPLFYLTAPPNEINGLLDGLLNSDGSIKRNTWTYPTTSKQVADTLQAILHLNGQAGSMSKTILDNPKHKDLLTINVSDRIAPRIETQQAGRSVLAKEEWVKYKGTIHCATVSTGLLIVRRNNKVIISGNSPHEHPAKACDTLVRSGPYIGWQQYRKQFPLENVEG